MKNIFITGATDGIGKLLAFKLAQEGHTLLLHGRSAQKLTTLSTEIKAKTNNTNLLEFVADFSDLSSLRNMVEQIKNKVSKIDILINNAGVFKSPIAKNEEGFDLRFVVNYLAPYLLTKELIPLLEKGTEARIINLSSAAQAPVSLEALKGHTSISVNEAYAQSKLALTMWSMRLAKEQKAISVIAVNPGSLLNTKMANEAYGQYWSPAEKGTDILYDLALSEEHKGLTGKYYDNDNAMFAQAHPVAYDEAAITSLISETEKLIQE
ncbi:MULTISPECIES: SDR family NAD(P)-dependent oxidoreductase [unclassified Lentimicrobium]|uniref:SDR family NAD(P)-dependent oxidoreductase n=1 Tax=unclassified Lentimicrobium TaxID=2677434 RepID=UPI001551A3CC|nr:MULTISPECIES: SDR family NAD(P)-dependent oxidoreductase [unclassified Lentimicrobium]NPD46938.1 SDR family NAD(P)-dependent oxidoreductase [Lentimicrobium sp. S6]NPD84141.1 SDR family NAD(P)-dependent oxidoreductase [Lentimicrobium sp. L6]